MEFCEECGANTVNEGSACKGAVSQQYHYDATFSGLNTNGLITCNCCDDCRLKCWDSFLESVNDGEQESNNI